MPRRVPAQMPPASEAQKAPRRLPKQARSGDTLHFLLEAVDQELQRGGIATFSVKAAAARAGVSLGSVYRLFATKEAILAAWEEWRYGRIVENLGSRISAMSRETLKEQLHESVRYVACEVVSIMRLVGAGPDDGHRSRAAERRQTIDRAAALIEAGLIGSKDAFRPHDMKAAATIVAWTVSTNCACYAASDASFVVDTFASELADMVTRFLVE